MPRKKKEESHVNHERWLITYADLITLLMVFFIIMYSMGRMDIQKYQQLATSLNVAFTGGGKSPIGTEKPPISEGGIVVIPEAKQMENAKKEVDEYLKGEGLSNKVETNIDERGLVISLQDTVIFDSGSAAVKPQQAETLVKIGSILKKMPNYIRVEGHTDNVPIKNTKFSSNWQLSSVRASNMVEILVAKSLIAPSKISAMGYGEYRPVSDNSTIQGRSKNRRVDIVILNSKYNETEKNSGPKVDPVIKK
ncbi:MAG: flagellar motor protein MotB [Clostridium sp.]|uniref:flagellar motor protein MotB n=1 Tax=Clostridium sp. TaxID=1506 RepID=UPI002FC9F971